MVRSIIYHNDNREVYKVGKFSFDADGSSVIVTKNTKHGIITINLYQYENHEKARRAADRMYSKGFAMRYMAWPCFNQRLVNNMTKTLTERIAEYNATTLAWVAEDPANRCATILVDDPEFWKEYGVENPSQFDRYMLVSTARDMFKDVHGFRPRHIDFDDMWNQEIQGFIDRLKTKKNEGF